MKTVTLILLLLLTACVAPQPALKIYDGPDKPLTEVASIRGSNHCNNEKSVVGETRIIEVNGLTADSFSSGYQRDLLIAPGKTSVTVYWFYAFYRTKGNVTLNLNAQAGHRYIVRSKIRDREFADFFIEDLGPNSGSSSFAHPTDKNGKPSNCY